MFSFPHLGAFFFMYLIFVGTQDESSQSDNHTYSGTMLLPEAQ